MTTWLTGSTHIFFYTVAALLPVANPVGMSAPFFTMTRHLDNDERKALARRVATCFFVLVLVTVLSGRLVLEVGIEITLTGVEDFIRNLAKPSLGGAA